MKKLIILFLQLMLISSCINTKSLVIKLSEKQLSFSPKTHALDNNDNFSPDGMFLCYDTRGTIYNENLANSKSIEKIEISTGKETVLWEPPSVSGEQAAPGVAAVSYHPIENKVIFIHGPDLDEVEKRGYYNIRNRTAVEVDGDGNKTCVRVDLRDILSDTTIRGAHRGGTHRHEYSRLGNRIGFTYDDFLVQDYDRTIGFMQPDENTPEGYSHYFSIILKPARKGSSKAGEIEKAYGDSWLDAEGSERAFIGTVRTQNGSDYNNDLFVADIPINIDLSTSSPGTKAEYPEPPEGISIRRLTHGMNISGIVRGSHDGRRIAFEATDSKGINQIFIIKADGSEKQALQFTNFLSSASSVRWHPSGEMLFCISEGDIIVIHISRDKKNGNTVKLTDDNLKRDQLVVSPSGNMLAYNIAVPTKDETGIIRKDVNGNDFRQIFILKVGIE